jgi:hypothetical protein
MPGWEDSNFGICQERSPAAWLWHIPDSGL